MSRIFVLLASIFVIGAISGWVIELFYRRYITGKKWVNPGLLTGPYLPIYGFGMLFLFLLSYFIEFKIEGNKIIEVILLFVIASLFMTFLELIGGLFFLKFYNLRLWDYTDEKMNYQGVICLKYSLLWGISSLIFYYFINPPLISFLQFYSDNIYLSFFVGIIFGFMILDAWSALQVTYRIKKIAKQAQEIVHYEEFKELVRLTNEQLDNRKRFFVIPSKEIVSARIEELINRKK